jgi:hypothetical protein
MLNFQKPKQRDNGFSIPQFEAEQPQRQVYPRRLESPVFFYAMAGVGLVALSHFFLSFLKATPIGLTLPCGILAVAGIASHWILTYHSAKLKTFSFWLLWVQSGFMLALSFYLSSEKCL